MQGYFNYSKLIADGYWDRHGFVRAWWRVYHDDTRWVPPDFPTFYRYIVRSHGEHLERMSPRFIRLEALPDTRRPSGKGTTRMATPVWETTVGAAVLLADPRRQDRTGYLALWHCVNDTGALERFTNLALETAAEAGCHRLVGPTGLSPHLQSGVLQDYFSVTPPLHTPYNPPYVPEVMRCVLHPMRTRALFHVSTVSASLEKAGNIPGGVRIARMQAGKERATLLKLFMQVFDDGVARTRPSSASLESPPPDAAEAEFLLDWISVWPIDVWMAFVDDEAVGFAMMQPDLAGPVNWAKGGRNHLRRAWLAWRSRRPVRHGRLLFGGVLPGYRGRGIGSLLWEHALNGARLSGWQSVSIGPLPLAHPAVPFLRAKGAEPRQTYRLYTTEL